jgi:hypothetical protein
MGVIFTLLVERYLDTLHQCITTRFCEDRGDEYVGRIPSDEVCYDLR